jgi:hypothetical protein
MTIREILAKPVWKHLAPLPGFSDLSAPSIEAADSFFDFLVSHNLASPTAGDIRSWLDEFPETEHSLQINLLQEVFAVCQPSFLGAIREARQNPPPKRCKNPAGNTTSANHTSKQLSVLRPVYEARDWDPIAPPSRRPPKRRHVSVSPSCLPAIYQSELRRAADGLPAHEAGMQVPARSLVLRMREKLCQYVYSAKQRNLNAVLTPEGIDGYLEDLKTRLQKRPQGLRWATLRASTEALLVFARYSGAPPEVTQHLKAYYREFENRETSQKALKFFALARTGNTTDRILDLAETLLNGVDAEESPKKRHQMRNGAAILAIFANVPLRNASAQLVFGATLLWAGNEWRIRTKVQKTHARRPEILDLPLHPVAGRFIDALILGDASPALLPTLRERMIKERRQLFVLPDGSPAAATYVPRVFQALTGNSFTTLRVMHYSDAIKHHGHEGIELAKPSAHHANTDIVKKHYIAEQVAENLANNIRNRRRRRMTDDYDRQSALMASLEEYGEKKPT